MNEYLLELMIDLSDEEWFEIANRKKARKRFNEYDCDIYSEDSENVA